jgi:hypothetical protein
MKKIVRKYLVQVLLSLLLVTLCGCAHLWPVEYDDQAQVSVALIQKRMELFLAEMERQIGKPEGNYVNNAKFYDDLRAEINTVRTRAAAIPDNKYTVSQLGLLNLCLLNLEKSHEFGLIMEDIPPMRDAFNSYSNTIIKYDISKRRNRL